MLQLFAIAGLLVWSATLAAGPVTTGADPETELKYWEWRDNGVLFRLTQRLPDQTRAFFMSRGFDKASADTFATSCVFQSMFRNIGDPASSNVRINLDEWQIKRGKKEDQMQVREDWKVVWEDKQLPQSARIAFEWSLLPTQQEYAPDDYNWGMTSYGLPPGSQFDLVFTWHRGDQNLGGQIAGIECAPDIHPEPDAVER